MEIDAFFVWRIERKKKWDLQVQVAKQKKLLNASGFRGWEHVGGEGCPASLGLAKHLLETEQRPEFINPIPLPLPPISIWAATSAGATATAVAVTVFVRFALAADAVGGQVAVLWVWEGRLWVGQGKALGRRREGVGIGRGGGGAGAAERQGAGAPCVRIGGGREGGAEQRRCHMGEWRVESGVSKLG